MPSILSKPGPYQTSDYLAMIAQADPDSLISITDARGIIVYVNRHFATASKFSPEELIGQNHRVLKSGHQPDELFESLWQTISRGDLWRGNIKNRAKNGSYFWVDTEIYPVFGPSKRPVLYVSIRTLINP